MKPAVSSDRVPSLAATPTHQIMKTARKQKLITAMLAGAAGLCLAGCQSFSNAPSGNLASITVTNQSMANVSNATAAVFATHGFNGGQTGANQFTFTCPGSRTDNLAYGSYMFDEVVTVKVVVLTKQLTTNSIYVGCNAWLVENANDPVFQDDHKVRMLRKWPYEQLLKDIQAQLGQ
jgi:hypothetical protein